MASPLCFAQATAGGAHSTGTASKTSQSPTSSPDAPDVVAPVSPPPVAPPAMAPQAASQGKSSSPNAASGNRLPANYDPLNPVTPTGEIDQRFLRWTPKTTAPAPKNVQTTAQPSAKIESTKVKPATTSTAPAASTKSTTTTTSTTAPAVSAKSATTTTAPATTTKPTAASQTLLKPQVPKIAEPLPAPDINKGAAGAQSGTPAGGSATGAPNPAGGANANAIEKYPAVANLEVLTFGETHPALPISDRLANLETTVFKETHPTDSLFSRTERLQKVLVGSGGPPTYEQPQYRPADMPSYARVTPPEPPTAQPEWADEARRAAPTGNPGEGQFAYFDEIAVLPENRVVVNGQQLQDYFLEMVNNERRKVGSPPLEIDPIAEKLATEHVTQLAERAQISHSNSKGENPDRRYTLAGGTDAVTESLVSLKSSELGSKKLYRGAAAKLLRVLMSHQDDRDALTSRDSTHVGFAAEWTSDRSRLIACADLVSKHAIIHPVPTEAHIDEKIDVKGVMNPPYQFVRVTLAWEGGGSNLASVADESEEALPYFPPLDYVAYQKRAESGGHDKAIMILKGVGIAAAIAGGVFMPPIALAAPLIAVSGGQGEHKPASEIPVKGGVKLEGAVFETKIPLSNEGKDGLYYLTVWGAEGQGAKPVPISRRVILVTGGKEDPAQAVTNSNTGEVTNDQTSKKDDQSASDAKKSKSGKKAKKNKNAPPSS